MAERSQDRALNPTAPTGKAAWATVYAVPLTVVKWGQAPKGNAAGKLSTDELVDLAHSQESVV